MANEAQIALKKVEEASMLFSKGVVSSLERAIQQALEERGNLQNLDGALAEIVQATKQVPKPPETDMPVQHGEIPDLAVPGLK